MSLENSVVCLTSSDDGNHGHGTGFIIKREGHVYYLVTGAHVVEDLGGEDKIRVGEQPVKVIKNGAEQGIDLAVLRVELDDELQAFWLEKLNYKKDVSLKIIGHRTVTKKSPDSDRKPFNAYVSSDDHSSLGKKKQVKRPFEWTIKIQKDSPEEIQEDSPELTEGCSGSPAFNVYQEEGFVSAVLIVKEGKQGRIIPITYLEKIHPDLYRERISDIRPKHLSFFKRALPKMVYSIDHKRFKEKFCEAIKNHINHEIKRERPFLCFIPNCASEVADYGGFIKILEQELEEKKLLREGYKYSKFITLEEFKDGSELCERMEKSLKKYSEILLDKTRKQPSPVILWASLSTDDWYRAKGKEFIYEFVHFWSKWSPQDHLFLVLLFFHYKERNYLESLFNIIIGREFNKLDSYLRENEQISGSVLKEFSSFGPENIRNWMHELANNYDICDLKDRELNQICTEIDKFIEDKKNKNFYFMKDLNELYSRLADLVDPSNVMRL